MSSVSAVGIPNNGALNPCIPPSLPGSAAASANQSPRSIYSVAKAIISWVYNNLAALWNQISVWCLRVIPPRAIATQQGQSYVDKVNGTINHKLSQQAAFPNIILATLRMEGKCVEPLLTAMNLEITRASQTFAWSGGMNQAMRDYLAANAVTKIGIEFSIATPVRASKFDFISKKISLVNRGSFYDEYYEDSGLFPLDLSVGVHPDDLKSCLKKRYPMFSDSIDGQLDNLLPDDAAQQAPYDRGEASCHQ